MRFPPTSLTACNHGDNRHRQESQSSETFFSWQYPIAGLCSTERDQAQPPRLGRCGVRGNQFLLPVGQNDVQDPPDSWPFLTGSIVTVTSSPALNDVRDHPRGVIDVGLLCLHGPVPHSTVPSFRIELQEAVRVAPDPFRYGPLQRDFPCRIERRCAVMGEERNRNQDSAPPPNMSNKIFFTASLHRCCYFVFA